MSRIKFERKRQGVSVKTLAKAIKIPTLIYIMRERRLAFSNTQYEMLCNELNIDFDDDIYL